MYIKKISITNIRSIKQLDWEINDNIAPGWHVIIGDNGSGKSTFLRSVALALVGPNEALALRQDWNTWLSRGESQGVVHLDLLYNEDMDKFTPGRPFKSRYLPVAIGFERQEEIVRIEKPNIKADPDRYVWGGKPGWFSASYGPFRRFTGGDKDYERVFYSNPKLAAHLSVFGENVALTESIRWLQDLQFKKLENQPEGKLLDDVKKFINQEDFLPYKAYIQDISSRSVDFVDGNGNLVSMEELSDGYRSILSMTFEIIRQLSRTYEYENIFDNKDLSKIIASGVVLIDEIDAHLHPTWQRRIGLWFRKHFPNLQFIVTTHSPLICQAATEGTVYRLPKPGSGEHGEMVTGISLDRLLYGNILDAYSTEVFGENITRSDESRRKLQRLAELNSKELRGHLTRQEQREQRELRAILPTTAHQMKNNDTVT